MPTMIEQVVKDVTDKQLRGDFPHLMLPGAMEATVTKASPLGNTYEYSDIRIEGCEECPPYQATLTGKWFEYSLKILDNSGGVDSRFPEIPNVKSKIQVAVGGKVAVAMLYGELRPYIMGEAL